MNKKFELAENNYPKLDNIKLLCDRKLTHRKKAPKAPFHNCSFFYLVVGRPGSGKTTFLFNSLKEPYRKVFQNILYVCPKNSKGSIQNNILEDLEPADQFTELSLDVQDRIIDLKSEYDKKPEKNYNQLLIIDDCSAFLKNKENIKMLNDLSMNRRHLNLSIILLVQYLVLVPASVRSQVSSVILFKPSNNKDYSVLQREFINMKKDDFTQFINFVFKDKHDNLFINMDTGEYFKNLQRIIMN